MTGSNPGPFILDRHSIYFHEQGVWIVWLLFHGNNIYTGITPQIPPEVLRVDGDHLPDSIQQMWNQQGSENCSMAVGYISVVAAHRPGLQAITPSTYFGNEGAPKPHKLSQRTYSEFGLNILGNTQNHFNRLRNELIYQFYNGMKSLGLRYEGDLNELARKWVYEDEGEQACALLGHLLTLSRMHMLSFFIVGGMPGITSRGRSIISPSKNQQYVQLSRS